jgi:sugar fermentation stimulation protein A
MRVPRLVGGSFRERLTRFSCAVELGGRAVECFLPNPGRLNELLVRGNKALLVPRGSGNRKTSYDLFALRHGGGWVVVDSRVPNRLVHEALLHGSIPELGGYGEVIPEPSYASSRFDFLLKSAGEACLVEVKSCTLVKQGKAMFPDAPTLRGRRHMQELLEARSQGYRACVLFVVQREDAVVFSPNDDTDIEFGRALRHAAGGGVEVLAYASALRGDEVALTGRIRVEL